MLNGIMPVSVGIMSPKKDTPRHPWVLDETLPRTRNPQEVMNEIMWNRELEKAKNKPLAERNIFDYLMLVNDYVKNNPHVMYKIGRAHV